MNSTERRDLIGIGARVAEVAAETQSYATRVLVGQLLDGNDVATALQRFVEAHDEEQAEYERREAEYLAQRERYEDRLQLALSVPCPRCEMPAGLGCRSAGGHEAHPHAARQHAAQRQEQQR